MRAIDAEGIRIKPEFMHDVCGMAMIRVKDIVRILNEQPEIVRCKDCKYGTLDHEFPHEWFCSFKGDEWNNEDYFCGHAKKREVTL